MLDGCWMMLGDVAACCPGIPGLVLPEYVFTAKLLLELRPVGGYTKVPTRGAGVPPPRRHPECNSVIRPCTRRSHCSLCPRPSPNSSSIARPNRPPAERSREPDLAPPPSCPQREGLQLCSGSAAARSRADWRRHGHGLTQSTGLSPSWGEPVADLTKASDRHPGIPPHVGAQRAIL